MKITLTQSPSLRSPVVVRAERSWDDCTINIRVDFLCDDGELCIPFTVNEEELARHPDRPPRLNITREQLKQRLLLSLQIQAAKEILDA